MKLTIGIMGDMPSFLIWCINIISCFLRGTLIAEMIETVEVVRMALGEWKGRNAPTSI